MAFSEAKPTALESRMQRFAGAGSVRQLAAGTTFTLTQHEDYADEAARFTILAVTHYGANNLGAQAAQLLGRSDVEAGTYRNELLAQPAELMVHSGAIGFTPLLQQDETMPSLGGDYGETF